MDVAATLEVAALNGENNVKGQFIRLTSVAPGNWSNGKVGVYIYIYICKFAKMPLMHILHISCIFSVIFLHIHAFFLLFFCIFCMLKSM